MSLDNAAHGRVVAAQVWKRFRADHGRRLLRDEIQHLQGRVRGDVSKGYRWALQDISFEAERGEAVGLIGANGSGKSTLLKILTRVMYPYAGRVEVHGRVGALIEVRAGIHPDLTGRENVYLYGSLLGLPRKEVRARFDEIVEFAELTGAVDRQVKFYSSGMQMRLGFAVAAFLEPDVLLVDEVLAVGDASFQQRCLDRMREVLAQGTTLVFVSHDLAAVEAMCSRVLWLDDGILRNDGSAADTLAAYRRWIEEAATEHDVESRPAGFRSVTVTGPDGGPVRSGESCTLRMVLSSKQDAVTMLCVGVSQGPATPIFAIRRRLDVHEGDQELFCTIDNLPLPSGQFYVWAGLFGVEHDLLPWRPAASFAVQGEKLDPIPRGIMRLAPVYARARWSDGASSAP